MAYYFISDLHLKSDLPQTVNRFAQFCNQLPSGTKGLYILGDLFETWVGDDDLNDFSMSIIDIIKGVVNRHVPVYFQHGNRDFFISKRFATLSGCTLLPEEYVITIQDKRILLMHGDTLCINDIAYQKARKKLRNRWLQWMFLQLPLKARRTIAERMRNKSENYTKSQDADIMDVNQTAVIKVMKKHQVDLLIHGHTHHEGVHTFNLNDKTMIRIVLPAWHDKIDALVLDENGEYHWQPIL